MAASNAVSLFCVATEPFVISRLNQGACKTEIHMIVKTYSDKKNVD